MREVEGEIYVQNVGKAAFLGCTYVVVGALSQATL